MTRKKWMILEAIIPMFNACGNSYINAWLEEWLRAASTEGVYDGPYVGSIAELDLDKIYQNSALRAGFDLHEPRAMTFDPATLN